MDIEELSKSQLLLLTMLVNFITSIAVSVLTVSLLAQAPTTVTQTVNRIVDHTIETVATGTPLSTIVSQPTTITKTVVQYEDSQLPDAVGVVSAHLVSIYGEGGTTTPFIARGTYMPTSRAVVTVNKADGLPQRVVIEFPNGTTQTASVAHQDGNLTIYGFGDAATLPKASTLKLAPHDALKLGQTAVTLSSEGKASTGIVSKVTDGAVYTTLSQPAPGTAVVDIAGNVIGIANGSNGDAFPADEVTKLLTATTGASGS